MDSYKISTKFLVNQLSTAIRKGLKRNQLRKREDCCWLTVGAFGIRLIGLFALQPMARLGVERVVGQRYSHHSWKQKREEGGSDEGPRMPFKGIFPYLGNLLLNPTPFQKREEGVMRVSECPSRVSSSIWKIFY